MILKLIITLIMIESGGNPNAIGDNGRAVGILQIHPIMVEECNRIAGEERWTLDDRWSPTESVRMCSLFLSHRKSLRPNSTMIELGCTWNSGGWSQSAEYKKKLEAYYTRR